MSDFLKGKVSDYHDSHRGWITGSFFPREELNHDTNIEIKYDKVSDDFKLAKHLHSQTKTWVIVLKGKMYFKINDQPVEVGAGEFIIFPPNVAEEIIKVDPGTEAISMHSPSVPGGDRVVL